MSEKRKSKTNVAARADAKAKVQLCRFCGKEVDIVLAVGPTGKKRTKRLCCET